jgi:hypothetical protein
MACLSRQWSAQQQGGRHDLPAMSHLYSLEPITKCQNNGNKVCDYKKWNSWTLTLLYTLCSERTCSALLLLCYRLKEKEVLYRKVISQFENNNQRLVRENITLWDTYCRLHTKLRCLTQQFTVLAVSTITHGQYFIWQLVSVMSCSCVGSQLRALH